MYCSPNPKKTDESVGGNTGREISTAPFKVPTVAAKAVRCESALSMRSGSAASVRSSASSDRGSLSVDEMNSTIVGGRALRKRKTAPRAAASRPSDSSEGEPAPPAKFLALEETTAPVGGRQVATDSASAEVERLVRSLTEVGFEDSTKLFRVASDIVSSVAAKSGRGFKGIYLHALKCLAATIEDYLNIVTHKTSGENEECVRLQRDQLKAQNAELQNNNLELRAEIATLHMRVDELMAEIRSPAPPDVEEVAELKRRIAILEARSSPVERARPLLAHERRAGTQVKPQSAKQNKQPAKHDQTQPITLAKLHVAKQAKAQQPVPTKPQPAVARTGRDRTKKKGVNAAKVMQYPQPCPLPPVPSSMDVAWTTVVKRGQRKTKEGQRSPRSVQAVGAPRVEGPAVKIRKNRRGGRSGKTRAPRSAAVVLELLPAAKDKGITYEEVMARARGGVDIDAIGVEGGLKVRHTANGARLLECPGADSGAVADRLMARLREILPDPEVVRIDRPVRMAEIKVTGLDECATKEEVAAAIALQGNCALANVKVGELRSTYSGTRSVWARCPVQTATLLATPAQGKPADTPGRLRVGWVIAHVQLQEARPWRCLRCFGTGHGLAKCSSAVDRSGLCFRCGQSGHKAASCTAAMPHCVLCDAEKRRANHRVGGPACHFTSFSSKRRKGKINKKKPVANKAAGESVPAAVLEPEGGTDEGAMDVAP